MDRQSLYASRAAGRFQRATREREKCYHETNAQGRKDVTGFYIALDTLNELPRGIDYQVALMSIIPKPIADDVKRFAKVVEVTDAVAALLKVPGIAVVDVVARSAAEVSLEDIALYRRLEFDYISEGYGGERPIE